MTRDLPFDVVSLEDHRRDLRQTRYRAARRWADRLPHEEGEDKAKTYRLMIENLKKAVRT